MWAKDFKKQQQQQNEQTNKPHKNREMLGSRRKSEITTIENLT